MKGLLASWFALSLVASAPAFAGGENAGQAPGMAGDKDKKAMKLEGKDHLTMHEKMADAHKKAADCLKEGKADKECHDQFKKESHAYWKDKGGMKGHSCPDESKA